MRGKFGFKMHGDTMMVCVRFFFLLTDQRPDKERGSIEIEE